MMFMYVESVILIVGVCCRLSERSRMMGGVDFLLRSSDVCQLDSELELSCNSVISLLHMIAEC